MSEFTRLLAETEAGSPRAAEQLLPLVYDELRRVAAARLRREPPGQSLDATALVHEAYVRLAQAEPPPQWRSSRHFVRAAARAMRRILIDRARRRQRLKRAPQLSADRVVSPEDEDLLAVHDALRHLAEEDPLAAELAELRVFGGLSVEEAGQALALSRATAYRNWTFARAWLEDHLANRDAASPPSDRDQEKPRI